MNDEITLFAETNFRNARRRFGIKTDDRRRHVYVIGKTGVGKTTLLENMVVSDILAGKGVGVVDPHGEFAEKMLEFVPPERVDDVIYFDPSDLDWPIAFNPIESVSSGHRHLVASGLMGVFKKIWPDVWSARMEYILNNTILALLESPGSTLLGIMRMLSNKHYRKHILEQVTDPVVKSFWRDEFARYHDRFEVEAIAPIQNKVGQFLSAAVIRNIVGQQTSTLDMRRAMDEGKILIMNLSKGKIGEDNSKLLGGLLVAKLQLAAMSRVDIPENERRDFYLYVDEFQNFATESFANILSEARKYRLNLTLANQYIAQLTETGPGGRNTTVRDAIFGNIGTMVVFRVGADDAEFIEKEFEPEFMMNDIVDLPKYHIYLKLMIDGIISRPFSAITMPPPPVLVENFKEEIVRRSRERYAMAREEVERQVAEWSDMLEFGTARPNPAAPVQPRPAAAPVGESQAFETVDGQKLYEATCWEGGERVLVPFKPDGTNPVYCKTHAHLFKEISGASPASPVSLREALGAALDVKSSPLKKKKRRPKSSRPAPDVNFGKLRDLLAETRK